MTAGVCAGPSPPVPKKTNIPVTTTIHAMGSFDETNDLSLEFLGMHGNAVSVRGLEATEMHGNP